MRQVKLTELADVVRSKNAGPYELTLDVFFKSQEIYRKVKAAGIFDRDLIKRLYGLRDEEISGIVYFDPAHAVKITIARPVPSGSVCDTDVYGAQ